MHQDRLALMRQTRENMVAELKGVLAELKLSPEWEDIVFSFPKKKFKHLSVRGPFAVAVYRYLKEQAREEGISLNEAFSENLFTTQLPFIAEMVMTIQYLENHILDGKDGVNPVEGLDWELIKDKLLASHYLKDFLYSYARRQVFHEACPEREILLDCLRRMFQFTEEGQFAERRWSSLEHVRNGIPNLPPFSREVEDSINYELIEEVWGYFLKFGMNPKRESFARFYLKRVHCTSSALFVSLTECIIAITQYNGAERSRLTDFAARYGILSQMVNDLADFIPASFKLRSVAKTEEDAYSDLRNRNFTLPFLFWFTTLEQSQKLLEQNLYDEQVQKHWFEEVRPKYISSITVMLAEFSSHSDELLNLSNKYSSILIDFFSLGIDNKYYQAYYRRK